MRLLHRDNSGKLRLADLFGNGVVPRYAILSHTWEEGQEVTYSDIQNGTGKYKNGWTKLHFCEKMSKEADIDYFWVDTCCIDKSSSAELQEAITSMFRWYSEAAVCLVYLSDVSSQDWKSAFRKSRWFTRGWTLQELLAPETVEFYSKEETYLGSKRRLEDDIHEVTTIHFDALRGKHLSGFSKVERMSWAVHRQTKREEDAAYSLFGIFDIHLPVMYGEGRGKALRRLEDQIDREQSNKSLQDEYTRDLLDRRSGRRNTLKRLADHVNREQLSKKRHSDKQPKERRENKSIDKKLAEIQDGERKKAQEKEERIQREKKLRRRAILKESLLFDEMYARHATIKAAHAKTCEWFLDQMEYKDWLNAAKLPVHNGFLWIKGKPGAGKSTLTKFALGSTQRTIPNSRTISYFFNARGHPLEKSIIGTYRSLLSQILNELQQPDDILDTISLRMVDQTSWMLARPWDIASLQDMLSMAILGLAQTRVLCFIDALDECEERQIRDMMDFLENLCALAVSSEISFRVCLSSRHYPHVTIRKGISLVLDGHDGHTRDIAVYLQTMLRTECSPFGDRIQATIQARASGIFMWVVLVVAILNKEYDHGRVHRLQQTLEEIPSGLHELFNDILTRDTENSAETVLCIQWLLFSTRPLHPQELYHAILAGVEPRAYHMWGIARADARDVERYILSCSKGLADITRTARPRVQFIHESVREFLINTTTLGNIWPILEDNLEGQSHEKLKTCCLAYFHHIVPHEIILEHDDCRPYDHDHRSPFLHYALDNVLRHADIAANHGFDQGLFLLGFPLGIWSRYLSICMSDQRLGGLSFLCVLAMLNLPNLIKIHPSKTQYLKVEEPSDLSPLLAALRAGHGQIVEEFVAGHISLLPHGNSLRRKCEQYRKPEELEWRFPHMRDSWWMSQVHCLVHLGDTVLMALALHAREVGLASVAIDDADEKYQETPLILAARLERQAIARMLIETKQVNVNAQDRNGYTPLMLAASNGNFLMAKDLIEIGQADTTLKNLAGDTALSRVQGKNSDRLTRLLLEAVLPGQMQRTLHKVEDDHGCEVDVIVDAEE